MTIEFKGRVPEAVKDIATEINKTPERKFEKAKEELLATLGNIRRKTPVVEKVWRTPKIFVTIGQQNYDLWVEDNVASAQAGSADETIVKMQPRERATATEYRIIQVRTGGIFDMNGEEVTSHFELGKLNRIVKFIDANLPEPV